MRILTSLNAKTGIAYLLLALLNISVITGLIFENQSDLIVRSTLLEAEKAVFELNDGINRKLKTTSLYPGKRGIETLDAVLKGMGIKAYAVLSAQAEVLSAGPEFDNSAWSEKDEFVNINRAIFKKENTRKIFHAEIVKSVTELKRRQHIVFYIPLPVERGESIIVRLPVSIQGIDEMMTALYRQLGLLIAGMIVVLGIFALASDRMVIRPVKLLSRASLKVSEGDYSIQVSVKNRDEIGTLTGSFNGMVKSLDATTGRLKESIARLEEQSAIIQDELDIAKTIQEGMLPQSVKYSRFSLSVHYRALEKISGDYYDIIEFPDGSCGIFIADVSGHGIPAALITIMAKFILYTYGPQYADPGALMERMNRDIARTVKTGDYLTAFYMILDTRNRVRFVNAGHHNPIVCRKRTGAVAELEETGVYLGMIEDLPTPFHMSEARLEKGDRLILFTDGITERMNTSGKEYSVERLKEKMRAFTKEPIGPMVGKIIDDMEVFAQGSERMDDYTLMAVEITADPEESPREKVPALPQGKAEPATAEMYMKSAFRMHSGNDTAAHGEISEEHGRGLRIILNGNDISHVEVPLTLLSSIYRSTFPHKNCITIASEYISSVPAGEYANRDLPKHVLLRVISETGKFRHVDISTKILSEELSDRDNGNRNFVRIKTHV